MRNFDNKWLWISNSQGIYRKISRRSENVSAFWKFKEKNSLVKRPNFFTPMKSFLKDSVENIDSRLDENVALLWKLYAFYHPN